MKKPPLDGIGQKCVNIAPQVAGGGNRARQPSTAHKQGLVLYRLDVRPRIGVSRGLSKGVVKTRPILTISLDDPILHLLRTSVSRENAPAPTPARERCAATLLGVHGHGGAGAGGGTWSTRHCIGVRCRPRCCGSGGGLQRGRRRTARRTPKVVTGRSERNSTNTRCSELAPGEADHTSATQAFFANPSMSLATRITLTATRLTATVSARRYPRI